MKQVFILLMATVVVFVAPGVQGTDHLSFSNVTANVTRTGCGTSKLCVETPDDCDPTMNNSCLFTSVNGTPGVAPNGTTLNFELSGGNNTGDFFIAVAITANASEGNSTVFICGRNQTTNTTIGVNGTFFFRTMLRNNSDGTLTPTERNVTGIQNLTTSNRIQCEFVVPGLNATARRTDTTFVVLVGTGTVNGSSPLNFTANVTTPALNLTDPTSNLNTTMNTTSSVNITRTGCGSSKLCVETPDDCDPATNNTCLFTSVSGTAGTAPNGATLSFELSGANSTGDRYIGVALTANASEGTSMLYVCGRNGTTNGVNGTFFFLTVQRNNTNGMLTVMNGNATAIQNLTSDTKIQCVFNVTGVNATARARAGAMTADTTFVVLLGSGTVNGSTLGNFTANVTTAALNLTDPTSNLNTTSSVNITRTGCGSSKLCVETPDDCDPATNDTCLFTSVSGTAGTAPNGAMLSFELSGANSTGDRYIGVALTANASEGTSMLYVCGRNGTTNGTNGTFFFLTVQRNNTNGTLTVMNGNATAIQNLTSDTKIQCVFNITGVNATARARARAGVMTADTTFVVLLGSGTVNGSTLGNFTANVTTAALNLTDPTSNLNTTSSVNITRTGCGSSKLCVETPDDCDPATNDTCLFTSVSGTAGTAPNGAMLSFELSGANSTGDRYIGVALTANASEGTSMLYVCGRNGTTNGTNGTFFFLTVQRNNTNGTLTVMNGNATAIQNLTSDTKIQCVFNVTGVNATARARAMTADTTFVVLLGSGTVNGSDLGNFTANVTTAALNVVDPASNLNTTMNTTSSVNITRTGCGSSKLCVETPDDCDPATNNTCLFTSVSGTAGTAPNGAMLSFELSGANSTGDRYIGVALTANASEGTSMLYVCGRNGTTNGVNGTFFFLTVQRNNTNGTLTVMNGNVTAIQNLTSDTKIQCVFNVTGVNATARARARARASTADTTFVVLLGSGTVNGSTLGNFTANVTTAALNVIDPASNLNSTMNTTSTSSVNITRTGCGSSKLCVEAPDDCDPATNDTCLFISVRGTTGVAPNGPTLSFELSGANSTGDRYIGVALTTSADTATLYVCGRNGTTNGVNGTFFFLTVQRNNTNGALTVMNTTATGIQNSTSDIKIQCVFNITILSSAARNAATNFGIQLGSGSVSGSTLGNFTANVTTPVLNLLDPASNVNPTSSVNITRTGCGSSKLCVETPDDCDPATNNTCLFTSVSGTAGTAPNGAMLSFELSGANSTGDRYIGVALTANASEGTSMLYVCGRNGTTNGVNGTFFFLTVQINNTNGALTVMNGNATAIQNSTSDTKIQCVFNVTGVNATARARARARASTADTTFVVLLGSGTVNGSTLGNFTANVTTAALNVIDPASNLNSTMNTTSSVNITRTGCGSSKLCVETPDDCDPATNNTCLFTSVSGTAGTAPNGAMLSFELSGANSTGDRYIGVALTANASEGTSMLYVCGRNGTTNGTNGTFFFLTVQKNNTNGALTVMNTTATGIQNSTSDVRIQCVFNISGVNATATARPRNAATTFVVQLGSGTVNGSTLGNFTANVTTAALNLLDPTSNLNSTTNTTTNTPPSVATTMSGANSAVVPQVVSLLLSLFILTILKAA